MSPALTNLNASQKKKKNSTGGELIITPCSCVLDLKPLYWYASLLTPQFTHVVANFPFDMLSRFFSIKGIY
jgi:hypothetical protein